MDRRKFGGVVAATAVAGIAGSAVAADEKPPVQTSRVSFPSIQGGRRPEIAMLVYPGLTLMDMLGPHTVLSLSCNVHLVWKNMDLMESDTGVVLRPSMTLKDCPQDLDAIFVGGGPGQLAVMKDPEVMKFLADRGARAKWITSVCSGSLVLGAAGLLKGYNATSHWACHAELELFGATPVVARVVTDRNRITGGGVTAGIDFGLTLLAKMLGEDIAKMSQLGIEYDPAPPFDAGTPQKAGEKVTKMALDWMAPVLKAFPSACAAAAKDMDNYAAK
ncbi:DJ-1/PfpI family protein [Blastopirellula sp. J2-11]|uniref:DJ-1/PfpI family protein n=1 Tax=Blastopirellula sp. J2-11 TaxID=2943192 RepID=UPI0021CA657D|nr:DJ-1/PfpI family protein [Blastopirellula sp. J2-11]UUO06230.1 DJ-1/PfpI family protein [Blastopirellula sp. J2-11]